MYTNETSSLLLNGNPTEPWAVTTGVRQGASTSPTLFNLIPEQLGKLLLNSGLGVRVGDKTVPSLMYADDIILIAPSKGQLQHLCHITETWASSYGLELNA
jgi:hypothetical protein